MKISKTLMRFNDQELPTNFVSIAVEINQLTLEACHAAILIRYNSVDHLYHFPGNTKPEVIENFNKSGWYIYSILDSFNINDPSEIGSFLQYCRRICKKSEITYSYISDGSNYHENGDYNSSVGLPELGTCVGFCLNTLTNALIDVETSIVNLEDWDDFGIIPHIDAWSINQAAMKYPSLDWSVYNSFKKRITPLEYLCTSYFNEYPIKKADINKVKDEINRKINAIYK